MLCQLHHLDPNEDLHHGQALEGGMLDQICGKVLLQNLAHYLQSITSHHHTKKIHSHHIAISLEIDNDRIELNTQIILTKTYSCSSTGHLLEHPNITHVQVTTNTYLHDFYQNITSILNACKLLALIAQEHMTKHFMGWFSGRMH
ncbi:hypothetical protein ACJX0J_013196 [Zea mays]